MQFVERGTTFFTGFQYLTKTCLPDFGICMPDFGICVNSVIVAYNMIWEPSYSTKHHLVLSNKLKAGA